MQAKMEKRWDITIVHLEGCLNYDVMDPFRQAVDKLRQHKTVFNLQSLSFVGSTGITSFVETVNTFAISNPYGTKLCGVSSEFRKIFEAHSPKGLEIFDNQILAESSFIQPAVEIPFP